METGATCWVLSDGKPGMENQCLGLAEALGVDFQVKRITPRLPWRHLPPHLWLAPLHAPSPRGDRLAPPWPDILIATGRQTVALSMAVRRASAGATYTVQIQNPGVPFRHFDLVVPPRHDQCTGDNVLSTRGALHRVTPERLAEAGRRFAADLSGLPRPLVAVLLGGTNKYYRLTDRTAARLGDGLRGLALRLEVGLAVTPSRRTGAAAEAALRDWLKDTAAVFWDGTGENPYFGYLALADAIVVTEDSVSMVSEACATGKPVYVVELEGGTAKFRRFHQGLREDGITRPFDGTLEYWTYEPPDDTARVAAQIRRRLAARGTL